MTAPARAKPPPARADRNGTQFATAHPPDPSERRGRPPIVPVRQTSSEYSAPTAPTPWRAQTSTTPGSCVVSAVLSCSAAGGLGVLGVDFIAGIAQNVIGDGVIVLVTLLLTIPAALSINAWRRRKLFRFFGVTKQHTRQLVYLSSLIVRPGGAIGFDGLPRSFQGHAIPSDEIDAARPIIETWSNARLDAASERLRMRLSRWWLLRRVTPEVTASPLDIRRLKSGGSVIAIGSQAYNVCTSYVMDVLGTHLSIVNGVCILQASNDGAPVREWTVDPGSTTIGTTGAAWYLCKRWRQLYRRFGVEAFAICLSFRSIGVDPEAFMKPEVVFETNRPMVTKSTSHASPRTSEP